MQISLGGFYIKVTQYLLYIFYIHTFFQHVSGETMPQTMKTNRFTNARFLFGIMKNNLGRPYGVRLTRFVSLKEVIGWFWLPYFIVAFQYIEQQRA